MRTRASSSSASLRSWVCCSCLVALAAAAWVCCSAGDVPAPNTHFLLSHLNDPSTPTRSPPPKGAKVLVLGSGGLIGRATVQQLQKAGYVVEEVKNRSHIDLRQPGALDSFVDIAFVMFLACEVGGAKFIGDTTGSAQVDILANNMKIYEVVFEWLARTSTPFLFTSTSLVLEPNAYGAMKRAGEAWVKAIKIGKIVRLWNIYGSEQINAKSHVVADWAHSCVHKGVVNSLTDGTEIRDFVHSSDCASALVAVMEHYDQAEFVSDIASAEWLTMREVFSVIADYFEVTSYAATRGLPRCQANFASTPASVRAKITPRQNTPLEQWWRPRMSLQAGVAEVIDAYRREKEEAEQQLSRKQDL